MLPGVEEVLALLAVRDLAASGRWDVVVVDCAPTAETLRLLALPEALGWYLQKVFPVQRRLARGMRPLATMLGRGEAIPPDDVFQALLQLSDDLASVRAMLADPIDHGAPGPHSRGGCHGRDAPDLHGARPVRLLGRRRHREPGVPGGR